MKKFAGIICLCVFAAGIGGCKIKANNSVVGRLIKPIAVTISGQVHDSITGKGIDGIALAIKRVDSEGNIDFLSSDAGSEYSGYSDTNGNFDFGATIQLEIDSYKYYLAASDPSSRYYPNESNMIFAVQDRALVFGSVELLSRSAGNLTTVAATVVDVIDESALAGVQVTVLSKVGQYTFTTQTDSTGHFSVAGVPVAEYALVLDGSSLVPAYVSESHDVSLTAGTLNDLGTIRLVRAIAADDMRAILSWNESAHLDLDLIYTFPREGVDINHAGTESLSLPSSDISINPAYGFGSGTGYWPLNMSGDDSERYRMSKDALSDYDGNSLWATQGAGKIVFRLGGQALVELDRNSIDGSRPEVLTIHKRSFLAAYPYGLSYHYLFGTDTQYPTGMGVFSVTCRTCKAQNTRSIFESGAVVKLYKGNGYLGSFILGDLVTNVSETNRIDWSVFLLELGFKRSNPATTTDIYFRPIRVGSYTEDVDPGLSSIKYYINEPDLPRSATFMSYLDYCAVAQDTLYCPTVRTRKIVGSMDGKMYLYRTSAETSNDFRWRDDALYPFGEDHQTPLFFILPILGWSNHVPYQSAFTIIGQLTGNPTTDVTIRKAQQTDVYRYSQPSSPLQGWDDATGDRGFTIFDMQNTMIENRLLAATTNGPRLARVVLPASSATDFNVWPAEWENGPSATLVDHKMMQMVLPVRDQYGRFGKNAFFGGIGLFYLECEDAYDHHSVGSLCYFEEVKDSSSGFSLGSKMIMDIVQMPAPERDMFAVATYTTTGMYPGYEIFLIEKTEPSASSGVWFTIKRNLVISSSATHHLYWDSTIPITDLAYFTINGQQSYLFVATRNYGLYYLQRGCLHPGSNDVFDVEPIFQKASTFLDSFMITKLFDYDGQLGALAAGNGLLYGPYPDIVPCGH
jgi:hypothetical protein